MDETMKTETTETMKTETTGYWTVPILYGGGGCIVANESRPITDAEIAQITGAIETREKMLRGELFDPRKMGGWVFQIWADEPPTFPWDDDDVDHMGEYDIRANVAELARAIETGHDEHTERGVKFHTEISTDGEIDVLTVRCVCAFNGGDVCDPVTIRIGENDWDETLTFKFGAGKTIKFWVRFDAAEFWYETDTGKPDGVIVECFGDWAFPTSE